MATTLIDGFVIDAATHEEHNYESEVTAHPVEDGSEVVDHVRAKPVMLTLTGIVSDTPIGNVAALRDGTTLPSDDAHRKLTEIHEAREPITVETMERTYENMVMESLQMPRDPNSGDALHFRATFRQIEFVSNERTTVTVAVPRAAGKTDRGGQASPELDESAKLRAQEQQKNKLRKQMGLTHDPTIGTDLIE